MHTHFTERSSNAKTGPIPVSTTTGKSCPKACPFNNDNAGGCYAAYGPLAIHWNKVTREERGTDFNTFLKSVEKLPANQLWRHNQAGDLPGVSNRIDGGKLLKLVKANEGKRGFTYTHKPMTPINQMLVRTANDDGFTINLSANNLAQADELADLKVGPVVVVLPDTIQGKADVSTPAGRKVVVCPATYKDDVSCMTCGLCQHANRTTIVGFPAHGTGKKKASQVAA
jgi:hypothetical protein